MYRCKALPRMKAFLIATVMLVVLAAARPSVGDMPPPPVGILELKAHSVPVVSELPGRVAATRVAEVRARVSGILQQRVFEQGALVHEGEVLYRIDAKLFRVRVASAEASLQRAKATQDNARRQFERQKALKERDATSGIDYDRAVIAFAQADADVALAGAALDEAKINLAYTDIRAPITGIIGAALLTEGALVTADGAQNLALIQQTNPAYVDFTQSAQELLALKHALEQGKLASPDSGEALVEIVLDESSSHSEAGKLLFASASVDLTTGQVSLRAEVPNPNRTLLPGMYVRVRITQAVRPEAVTIPQRAVLRAQDGRAQVYVISNGETAEVRDVVLGRSLGSTWLVEAGLKAGDRIIVEGGHKVQPGGRVAPRPWTPADQEAEVVADPASRSAR